VIWFGWIRTLPIPDPLWAISDGRDETGVDIGPEQAIKARSAPMGAIVCFMLATFVEGTASFRDTPAKTRIGFGKRAGA